MPFEDECIVTHNTSLRSCGDGLGVCKRRLKEQNSNHTGGPISKMFSVLDSPFI